jgi:hypothetical protein
VIKRKHVEIFIKKIFDEAHADFYLPTKESLIQVIDICKDFASCFRNKETIERHYNEIMSLIDRLQ